MRILVFNSKGGCGKSLVAREIIAAPIAKKMAIVEVDELNRTQESYKQYFSDVIELQKDNITDLLIHLNSHENLTIDVGADNLSCTMQVLIEYELFDDIDKVVIPLSTSRSDAENAFKTYNLIHEYTDDIMFAFTMRNKNERIEQQYDVFFKNISKINDNFSEKDYIEISASDVFKEAQSERKLVVNIAKDGGFKLKALKAKSEGDDDLFKEFMRKELSHRAAKILMNNCINPAHEKVFST